MLVVVCRWSARGWQLITVSTVNTQLAAKHKWKPCGWAFLTKVPGWREEMALGKGEGGTREDWRRRNLLMLCHVMHIFVFCASYRYEISWTASADLASGLQEKYWYGILVHTIPFLALLKIKHDFNNNKKQLTLWNTYKKASIVVTRTVSCTGRTTRDSRQPIEITVTFTPIPIGCCKSRKHFPIYYAEIIFLLVPHFWVNWRFKTSN